MKTIFYKKVGKRYVPAKMLDDNVLKAYPIGSHVIVVDKSWTSRTYNIDPDFPALKAASMSISHKLANILAEESKMRINKQLTPAQHAAWRNLEKELGETAYLEYPSMVEIAEKFLSILEEETKKVITNPAVKIAYEQFELIYKLTKNQEVKNEQRT